MVYEYHDSSQPPNFLKTLIFYISVFLYVKQYMHESV